MKILVLGGTGPMGTPLVQRLSQVNEVYVTSRSKRESKGSVKYIQGNAKDKSFLLTVLSMYKWDAVVDFMIHTEETLKELAPLFLNNTRQYVFISSSRVYSATDGKITEETPRLLEASNDTEYLRTNEYALAKAREEDILLRSGKKNFTIIRPTITYNTYRLQLGVLEKENWLYRALQGRSIVFSEDINDKLTTMTLGDDVAEGIASIVGEQKALGEIFHITSPISLPWSEVLSTYLSVLKKRIGKEIPVVMTKKSTNLKFKWRIYQVIYCRYFNRTFDNSKIGQFCDVSAFTAPREGLAECLELFLDSPRFSDIPWDLEAVNDRAAGEYTPLKEISGIGNKITYICYRYGMQFLLRPINMCVRIIRGIKGLIIK